MSINNVSAFPVNVQPTKNDAISEKCHCEHYKKEQISADDTLNGLNNPSFRPIIMTTNQLTFKPDGSIVADRRNSTIHNGKAQLGKPTYVDLAQDSEQKELYIDSLITKAKNIGCCAFIVDDDGTKKQIRLGKEKDGTISISSRDIETEQTFELKDKVEVKDSTDETIKNLVSDMLHQYGLENLTQIAITNVE